MKIKNSMLKISMLALIVCMTSAYADLGLGITNAWLFDEGAGDQVSDTVGGGAFTIGYLNYAGWGTGLFDESFVFDGTGAYGKTMQIPQITGAEQLTCSVWLKPNRASCDTWAGILSQKSGTGFIYAVDTNSAAPSGYLDWDIRIAGCKMDCNSTAGDSPSSVDTEIKLVDGQWNNIIWTWDYTKGVAGVDEEGNAIFTYAPEAFNVYINGVNAKGYDVNITEYYAGTDFVPIPARDYCVAIERYTSARRYAGNMDELALWTRVLDETEIAELWNAGTGTSLASLVGQATNPTPQNGDVRVHSELVTSVSWENAADASIASVDSYDVYMYAVPVTDPNAPDFSDVTPVNVASASMDVTLAYNMKYHWMVKTNYTDTESNAKTISSFPWSFTTMTENWPPYVKFPTTIVTSLDFMPAVIVPSEFEDDDSATFVWTLTPETEGMAVVDTSVDMMTPSAELTGNVAGDYTITLLVTDGAAVEATDSVVVKVAADECAAAQLLPTWPGFNVSDVNEDCEVNFLDLQAMIADWLTDKTVIVNP